MSATVVDPNFYYQPMRPETGINSSTTKPNISSSRPGDFGGNGPPPYRESFARSPKTPRHLTTIVRPVYDDHTNTTAAGKPAKFAEAEIIANPMIRRQYYRSVSSLDVSVEEDDTPKPTLLKEFSGSASSIDFSKTVGGNIRLILDQLRHGKSVTANSSVNSLNSLQNSDGSGSGSNVLCGSKKPKSERGKPKKSSLRSKTSIFRKIRGGSSQSESGWGVEPDTASVASVDGERIRRRIFAHYDTQSLVTKLIPAEEASSLSSRRNTTTGASAANFSTRCVLPSSDGSSDSHAGEDMDQGDGKSNHLLLNCPYFRNEITPEDCLPVVSPTSTYASAVIMRRPQGRKIILPSFRPHQGALVLEEEQGTKIKCVQLIQPRFEHIDNGAFYYRKYFHGSEHCNYFGMDEKFGPTAISMKKEKTGDSHRCIYRIIIRTSELAVFRGSLLEDSLPRLGKEVIKAKDIIECIVPEIQTSCLRLGIQDLKTEEQLLKLDEQAVPKHYKVGIMYCKAGQCTEEDMYNNESAGPAFDEFLDLLGQRIRLKSFDKYRAQLDNKSDSTGLYSLYTSFQDFEIMFHVSTMLPFTPSNKQQLLRKRHIGNDIVTIVFQEPGALPFSPKTIRSHFQHVFIVVRAVNPNTDHTQYMVSVSRSRDVPPFGPPLPPSGIFSKGSEFVDFILTKVINAENAAHKSDKFVALATRTRQEYLKDLANNCITSSGIESGFGKLNMFSLSGKKKDKPVMSFAPDAALRGALAWSVQARDFDPSAPLNGRMSLGISADYVVLSDPVSCSVIKIIPNTNVIGWKSQEESLTLYYHVGESLQILCDSAEDWKEIIQRLKAVTSGIEAVDLPLARNDHGHLGFHTQFNGIITDVDVHSNAWKAGLRRGCCLLEICGRSVNLLDHQMMANLLRHATPVNVVMLPPLEGGQPRRGCHRNVCIKAPEHVLSANYDNIYETGDVAPPIAFVQPVASRSTSSLVDGHVAFYLKSDSASKPQLTPSPPMPLSYDSRYQPTLDDLEAESRWWAHLMAEETARLNRQISLPAPAAPPSYAPPREPLKPYADINNATGANLKPDRPFERKISPNSGFQLFDSGTDTMSSTTSKSSLQSQKENQIRPGQGIQPSRPHIRHHKTDPGFRPPPALQPPAARAPLRNSPNKSSLKQTQHRHSVNLQEELLRLINPDLIDSDCLTHGEAVPSPSDIARRPSEEPSQYSLMADTPSPNIPASKSLEVIPRQLSTRNIDWRSIDNVEDAAKSSQNIFYPTLSSESSSTSPEAVSSVPKPSPPPLRPRSSSRKNHSRPVSGEFQPDRFVSAERIQELENRITKLIHDLNKEREDRMALETQVRQLKHDRLYDESLSTSVPSLHGVLERQISSRSGNSQGLLFSLPRESTGDSVPL